jgi:hypothetical protein
MQDTGFRIQDQGIASRSLFYGKNVQDENSMDAPCPWHRTICALPYALRVKRNTQRLVVFSAKICVNPCPLIKGDDSGFSFQISIIKFQVSKSETADHRL